jgi:protein-disulfide isomerase
MLVAILFIGPQTAAADRRLAWTALLVLAGAAAGGAVWFIIVQTSMVRAVCPYCMAAHTVSLLVAALVIWQAPKARAGLADPAPPQPMFRRISATMRVTVGLVLAGALALTQMAIKPPPVYREGASQVNRLTIDPRTVPLVGSPDAPYVVKLLFDYKCPHCRVMHSMLDDVVERYGGKVAFALCPSPMNNRCNPYIVREVAEFRDSCELTRLALAVWAAKRDSFAAFDRWMFSSEPGEAWKARTLDAANAKAVELLGQAELDRALTDPWVAQYLQMSVQIYGDTIDPAQGGAAVPKLVFGRRWVTPQPHDANDLVQILQDTLGIPAP